MLEQELLELKELKKEYEAAKKAFESKKESVVAGMRAEKRKKISVGDHYDKFSMTQSNRKTYEVLDLDKLIAQMEDLKPLVEVLLDNGKLTGKIVEALNAVGYDLRDCVISDITTSYSCRLAGEADKDVIRHSAMERRKAVKAIGKLLESVKVRKEMYV